MLQAQTEAPLPMPHAEVKHLLNIYRSGPERQDVIFQALAAGLPITAIQESSMIGDTIMSTGLLQAFMAAQRACGHIPQANLLIHPKFYKLFAPLEMDSITIGQCDTFDTLPRVDTQMRSGVLPGRGLLLPLSVFNFQDERNNWITSIETNEQLHKAALFGGVSHVMHYYPFSQFGYSRFARAVEKFGGLPDGFVDEEEARPRLRLPLNAGHRFEKLAAKYNLPLDNQTPSIGCVITASHPEKRYSVGRYTHLLQTISHKHPSAHFSIYYDGRSDDFVEDVALMRDMLNRFGMSNKCSFIFELNLVDVATLLAHHHLTVANDTGLAHISAALDVPTVTLFSPFFLSDLWLANKYHYGIQAEEGTSINDISETDILAKIEEVTNVL